MTTFYHVILEVDLLLKGALNYVKDVFRECIKLGGSFDMIRLPSK